MGGAYRYFLLILLISAPAFSQNASSGDFSYFGIHANDTNAIMDRIVGKLNQSDLSRANGSFTNLMQQFTLVVTGSSLNGAEKTMLGTMEQAYPLVRNATYADDSPTTLERINSGDYLVAVLLGGPSQNRITAGFVDSGMLNETDELYGQFVVQYGKTQNGTVILAVSDKRGYSNAQRESVKYSPLNGIVAPEYVPAAATGISLIMLALVNVARTVFEFKALDLGRKNKKVGEGQLQVAGVNFTELAAIAGASAVLGISISWQYFGLTSSFFFWVAVNTIICFLAGIVHEVTHRAFAHVFKIKVEYRFWPAGSAVTFISSYLGNAFSVQGFLLEEIPENVEKWKVGLMKLSAPLVSNGFMLLFAFLNVVYPQVIFQTIYTTSALWAFAEMLPLGALDGKDIKEWNFWVWLAGFLFIGGCYIFVTFLL